MTKYQLLYQNSISTLFYTTITHMWCKWITIRHKRNECIGCWSCVYLAPQNWFMDTQDGKATLYNAQRKGKQYMVGNIDTSDYDINQQAAKVCPVRIIQL